MTRKNKTAKPAATTTLDTDKLAKVKGAGTVLVRWTRTRYSYGYTGCGACEPN